MALSFLQKSALQGFSGAQYDLGVIYLNGMGVQENDRTAFEWFLKAAEQGLDASQYNVGLMYSEGIGIRRNMNLAITWMRRAAAQNYPEAIKCLREWHVR